MPGFQRPPGSGGADSVAGYDRRHEPLERDDTFPYDRTDPDKTYGRPAAYDRGSNSKTSVLHKPLVPLDADENPWDELDEMVRLVEAKARPADLFSQFPGSQQQLDRVLELFDLDEGDLRFEMTPGGHLVAFVLNPSPSNRWLSSFVWHPRVDEWVSLALETPKEIDDAFDSVVDSRDIDEMTGFPISFRKDPQGRGIPPGGARSGWSRATTAQLDWTPSDEDIEAAGKNEAKARPNDQISDLKKRLESVWKIIARVDVFTDTEVIERAAKETKKLLKLSPELDSESLSWLDRPMTDTKTRIETLQVIQTLLTNVADENGIFWGGMPSDGGSARNHPYSEELGEAKARPDELYLPDWLESIFEHLKDDWAQTLRTHGYKEALELADDEIDANTMGGQDRWTLMSAARQYLQTIAAKEGITTEMKTPWQVLEAFVSLRSTPSEPMGDSMGIDDLEADEKRQEFQSAFDRSLEIVTQLPDHEVLRLIVDLDPEFAADEILGGMGSDELVDIYRSWGDSAVSPDLPTDPEVDL